MDRASYPVLHGTYVAEGYAPDGDSIRFAPDRLAALDTMRGTTQLRVAKDCTVQLRLEGIDAPELHYQLLAQRLGAEARDALLRAIGFEDVGFDDDVVVRARPTRGLIVARGVDARGRVIAYAFRDGMEPHVGGSINAAMLRDGMAYPLAYDTQPEADRALFGTLARQARRRRLGIWLHDRTRAFRLATERSIGPHGALVFPKLFRRCVRYVADRLSGYRGGMKGWLEHAAGADNDVVLVGRELTRLSALIGDGADGIRTRLDVMTATFVAR